MRSIRSIDGRVALRTLLAGIRGDLERRYMAEPVDGTTQLGRLENGIWLTPRPLFIDNRGVKTAELAEQLHLM